MKKYARWLFVLFAVILLNAASALRAGEMPKPSAPSDYSLDANWLARPAAVDKPVDVFYLYPTAWMPPAGSDRLSCDIDDPALRAKAKELLVSQAEAFAPVGNLFAPYYRQYDAAYALGFPPEQMPGLINTLPGVDARAAFEYYLEHFNQGRPFILASHSQGSSTMLFGILFTLFKERPELLGRMVAAYTIGYSLTPDQLRANPHLRFATGRADTGVIVAYNTEAPGYDGANPVLTPGALAINPVTWTRGEERAPAAAGMGARINGVDYPCLADAQVDIARGVVRCSTVDPEFFWKGEGLFKPGVFHAGDFPFYFHDLRKNAADRVAAFPGTR